MDAKATVSAKFFDAMSALSANLGAGAATAAARRDDAGFTKLMSQLRARDDVARSEPTRPREKTAAPTPSAFHAQNLARRDAAAASSSPPAKTAAPEQKPAAPDRQAATPERKAGDNSAKAAESKASEAKAADAKTADAKTAETKAAENKSAATVADQSATNQQGANQQGANQQETGTENPAATLVEVAVEAPAVETPPQPTVELTAEPTVEQTAAPVAEAAVAPPPITETVVTEAAVQTAAPVDAPVETSSGDGEAAVSAIKATPAAATEPAPAAEDVAPLAAPVKADEQPAPAAEDAAAPTAGLFATDAAETAAGMVEPETATTAEHVVAMATETQARPAAPEEHAAKQAQAAPRGAAPNAAEAAAAEAAAAVPADAERLKAETLNAADGADSVAKAQESADGAAKRPTEGEAKPAPTAQTAKPAGDGATQTAASASAMEAAEQRRGGDASTGGDRRGEAEARRAASVLGLAAANEMRPAADQSAASKFDAFLGLQEAGKPATGAVGEAGAATTLRPSRGGHGLNHPAGVTDQVAVQIQKSAKTGVEKLTIQLRPEELGRVEVRMEIARDGKVTAQIAVERAQTLELLQKDQRALEKALQDAGLNADSSSLSFSLRERGDGRFGDQAGGETGGRRGRRGGGGVEEEETVPTTAYVVDVAAGRVDVRV